RFPVSPPIHKNAVSERKSSSLKSMTWLFLCLKSVPRLVQLLRMGTVTSTGTLFFASVAKIVTANGVPAHG
ncbi:MAG: hypothetical protein ACKN9F_03335, partial [Methylomonas sp.]